MLKIIFKNKKIYYFDIFLSKKHFEKQSKPHFQINIHGLKLISYTYKSCKGDFQTFSWGSSMASVVKEVEHNIYDFF